MALLIIIRYLRVPGHFQCPWQHNMLYAMINMSQWNIIIFWGVIIQYCAKVMRAKWSNFVHCLCEPTKKIHPEIQASFRNSLSVISITQRTIIWRFFKTTTKIPYQMVNSTCRMQNIAVQCTPWQQCSMITWLANRPFELAHFKTNKQSDINFLWA